MKQILLLTTLLFATNGYSQKYIIGAELNTFTIFNQTTSSIEKYSNNNTESNYKQKSILISPLFSFQTIQKNNILYGLELGFSKFKRNGNTTDNDLLNAQFVKRISTEKRSMYFLNISCGKKIHFEKFIFIAGLYIPFVYSPKHSYNRFDTLFDASTNQMTKYQNQNGQSPNYFETGIRFRTELNYPIYKKLYLATKLNLGFDYEHYCGKVNQNSEYFDGVTISNYSRVLNYKNMDAYSKHFSFGVGINYFF